MALRSDSNDSSQSDSTVSNSPSRATLNAAAAAAAASSSSSSSSTIPTMTSTSEPESMEIRLNRNSPTSTSTSTSTSASKSESGSGSESDSSPVSFDNDRHRSSTANTINYISSQTAAALDEHLMSPVPQGCGYELQQLMELAGLACAQAVYSTYPPTQFRSALVACGPGNQGGDGLVAARHLKLWGYDVAVWYPKPGKKEFLKNLVTQLEAFEIPILPEDEFEDAVGNSDVLLDAIFGFSFKGPVREPFVNALEILASESRFEFEIRRVRPPIVSVDIPSSWDVDSGNTSNTFTPEALISLSAPKRGVRKFKGKHFIGGRFIPRSVDLKFNLGIPRYFGDSQIVDVTGYKEAEYESPISSQKYGNEAGQQEEDDHHLLLMQNISIKGETAMTDKEKEILARLPDVTTPKAAS